MQEKIEIRGRFTPWHEATKEQAAQLARHHLHNLPAIPEAQRPAYIEAHFLQGGRRPMTAFSFIVTATGAATLAALFVRLLDRIDQPRKR